MPEVLDDEFAILAAVPLRHLRSGLDVCAELGRVALAVTGRGDLDAARSGDAVYLYAYQVGDRPVPAATWRATFVRAVDAEDGDHPHDGVTPRSWREDRDAAAAAATVDAVPTVDATSDAEPVDDVDDDPDALVGAGPPEVFLEVADLRELDKREWLFTNELVRKQDRGARTFVPLAPVRVLLPV